jgi:hypothetical protein
MNGYFGSAVPAFRLRMGKGSALVLSRGYDNLDSGAINGREYLD